MNSRTIWKHDVVPSIDKGRQFIPISRVIDTESVSVTNDVRVIYWLEQRNYMHQKAVHEMLLPTNKTWLYCGRPEAGTAPLLRAACDFLGREAGPPYLTVLVLA